MAEEIVQETPDDYDNYITTLVSPLTTTPQTCRAVCEALSYDPLRALITIAQSDDCKDADRIKIALAILPRIYGQMGKTDDSEGETYEEKLRRIRGLDE
jgi:hypothetical protein